VVSNLWYANGNFWYANGNFWYANGNFWYANGNFWYANGVMYQSPGLRGSASYPGSMAQNLYNSERVVRPNPTIILRRNIPDLAMTTLAG